MNKSQSYIHTDIETIFPLADISRRKIVFILMFVSVIIFTTNINNLNYKESDLKRNLSFLSTNNSCNYLKQDLDDGLVPEKIFISKLNKDIEIKPVSYTNGSWDTNIGVANYAIGTSLINMNKGNTGIYGENAENVFKNIDKLRSGDSIRITARKHGSINPINIMYQITKSMGVSESINDLFYPSEESIITIVSRDVYSNKLHHALIAEPVSVMSQGCLKKIFTNQFIQRM